MIDAVLTASESIVTFRRRYRGRTGVEAVIELLVTDAVQSALGGLPAAPDAGPTCGLMPNTSPTARPLRLLDSLTEKVRPPTWRPWPRRRTTGDPRWMPSSPSCRSSCAPVRGGPGPVPRLPPSPQPLCRARESGVVATVPHRAHHHLRLRRRGDGQLRAVPPATARPAVADGVWPTRSSIDPRADRPVPAHRPVRQHQVLLPRGHDRTPRCG